MSSSNNINPPMFASASSHPPAPQAGDPPAWLMEGNDPLDVDLLAEYLLDDGKPAPNGMSFDFNIQNGENSTVVSPEQSEDGGFPPVAEANKHQPLPRAPPAPQHHSQRPPAVQQYAPPHHTSQQHMAGMTAPPTLANSVPPPPAAAVAYAPAPPAPPQGQPMVALAPAPPMNGVPPMVVHHQHDSYAKRQRVEPAQPPVLSPVPSGPPTSSIVSGGQQMVDAAQAATVQQAGGRGRKKSQAQIDRRRERNRILARRTRLRKKFFFESLQKEVMDLQRQNAALKDLVKSKFTFEDSRKVLDTCKAAEKLPEAVVEACGEHAAEMDQQDFNLVRSVQQSQHSFIITDPCLQDNPIVFASDGFLKVTGYAREDVLGRNCRFLQGPETSKDKLAQVKKAIAAAEDVTVTMVNYMADGTPFWNKLFVAALRDSSNHIVNFIGVVVKVASPPEGDPEYGKVLATEGQPSQTAGHQANAIAADGAVKAIEGALTASVAAAPRP